MPPVPEQSDRTVWHLLLRLAGLHTTASLRPVEVEVLLALLVPRWPGVAVLADTAPNTRSLATRLGRSPFAVRQAVQAVAAAGLVELRPLRLTAAGEDLADSLAVWPSLPPAALQQLSEAERSALAVDLISHLRDLQFRNAIPAVKLCVFCTHFQPDVFPGTSRPHYCGLTQQLISPGNIRLDCPEHRRRRDMDAAVEAPLAVGNQRPRGR